MSAQDIDAELRPIARFLPRGLGPRALRFAKRLTALQGRRRPEDVDIVSVGDGIEVRVHRPRGAGSSEPAGALLWMHGGGFVIGHPAQDDRNCRRIADQLGVVVAAVRYRLGPEDPYPAGLHDCHDALEWLAAQPDVDEARIAIGGASAGGGMAASLALLARDRGAVAPAFQLLSYPMLDDRTVVRTDIDETGFRLWNNRSNRYGWTSYLGASPGAADADPIAVPARHEDLAGLPPAWIGVGTLDLFHDEDVAYAERLAAAGVPCELVVVEGAYHGFDGVAPKARVSREYTRAMLDALAAGLGTTVRT